MQQLLCKARFLCLGQAFAGAARGIFHAVCHSSVTMQQAVNFICDLTTSLAVRNNWK